MFYIVQTRWIAAQERRISLPQSLLSPGGKHLHCRWPGGGTTLAEDLLERPGTARANFRPVVVIKRYCSRENEIAKYLEGEERANAELRLERRTYDFQTARSFDGDY